METKLKELCSKCNQDFNHCQCDQFHPNRLALDPTYKPEYIRVSKLEAQFLLDYFINRAGYISMEFDEPVHKFIDKLKEFIEK